MNILYVARLSDSKLKEKLVPLANSPYIDNIYVLRDFPGVNFDSKVIYLSPKRHFKTIFRHIPKFFRGIYYCRKFKIDAVFGVLSKPHGFIGKTIAFFTHLPYVHLIIAGYQEFSNYGNNFEKLGCLIFRHSAFTMVTGTRTKKYLESMKFKPNRVVVIPNIPDNVFLNLQNISAIGEREYDIIFMSRIDKDKNLELLLKALSILKKKYYPKVLVVGDGPDLVRMQNLVSESGLNEYVDFKGYISKIEDKIDAYTKAKIFVSTSKTEGFPVSLLEAMCCGCVPLVSNVGDIADAIEQGVNGYLFDDTDNPKELILYLSKLFDNKSQLIRMSEESRKINRKISVNKNTEIWNGVLSKLQCDKITGTR
jgi:glycosyltransferase involved in cell wall biosynthesis